MHTVQCRKTILLWCIYKWLQNTQCFLDNDCSIEYINHLLQHFKNISYYAGIMLNALVTYYAQNTQCWHNWLVPTSQIFYHLVIVISALTFKSTSQNCPKNDPTQAHR